MLSLQSLQDGGPHQAGGGDGETVVSDLLVREGGEEGVVEPAVLRPRRVDVGSQVGHSRGLVQLHNQPGPVSQPNLQGIMKRKRLISDGTNTTSTLQQYI